MRPSVKADHLLTGFTAVPTHSYYLKPGIQSYSTDSAHTQSFCICFQTSLTGSCWDPTSYLNDIIIKYMGKRLNQGMDDNRVA